MVYLGPFISLLNLPRLISAMAIFTPDQVAHINAHLENLPAERIIEWAIITIPGLYQTTAFGLSGLVIMDMVAKLGRHNQSSVDLIFFDTLHHFAETLDLVQDVQVRYPDTKLHIYKPECASSEEEFASLNGPQLWETNELMYDYLVKVEPAYRAYKELDVQAVFTGRRRSQGQARSDIQIVEIDDEGLIKINPLLNWSFNEVQSYIKKNDVPYNKLLDQGYRSVGDYHSTSPVKEGEDERAGRWKGKRKTECGIHDTQRFAPLRKACV